MSSLNKLGRGEKPITEFGVGVQFEHHLVPTLAETLLHSKIIDHRGGSRGSKRIRAIQKHPLGDVLEGQSLVGSHLLVAPAALLLLLPVLVFGFVVTIVGRGSGIRRRVAVAHHWREECVDLGQWGERNENWELRIENRELWEKAVSEVNKKQNKRRKIRVRQIAFWERIWKSSKSQVSSQSLPSPTSGFGSLLSLKSHFPILRYLNCIQMSMSLKI